MSVKILGTFSLLIGIVGAALLTVGMTTPYWSQEGNGVWNGCSVGGCLAVQVMIVISIVFGIVHVLCLLLHVVREVGPFTLNIIMSAFWSAFIAVKFGVFSTIVYMAKLEAGRSFTSGWSLTLACAGIAIIFFNSIVTLLERCNQRAASAYTSI